MAKTKTPKPIKATLRGTKVAVDFDKIISEGRERKRNEDLAQRIFSKDRRQSAPSSMKLGSGPSLVSRVGVKKRASSGNSKPVPVGNINGDWTHDLHSTVNGGALASRVPGSGPRKLAVSAGNNKKKEKRVAQVAHALERLGQQTTTQKKDAKGLSIRGLAGPFSVMAQNFAPGTTAADIESAMTPVGGEMVSCEVIKTSPMILVEMVFVSKEGGEAVIEMFNNKTADGRLLKVYPKPGGYKDSPVQPPTGPRAFRANEGHVIDGSNGFRDLMDADSGPSNGRLYSDHLVGSKEKRSRGRGGR